VEITILSFSSGAKIASATTDPTTGYYKIETQVQGTFDVAYSKTNYYYTVVSQLAEKKPQQISRVLYRDGEKVSAAAAHDILQSMDRLTFLLSALPKDDRLMVQRRLLKLQFPRTLVSKANIRLEDGTAISVAEMLEQYRERIGHRPTTSLGFIPKDGKE